MSIYFVQGITGGPVKIGYAANVRARLADLQCGSPVRLRLLKVIDGGVPEEQALHRRFAADRLHGEWFRPTPEMRDLIAVPVSPNTILSMGYGRVAPPRPAPMVGPLLPRHQRVLDALHSHGTWSSARDLRDRYGLGWTTPEVLAALRWLEHRYRGVVRGKRHDATIWRAVKVRVAEHVLSGAPSIEAARQRSNAPGLTPRPLGGRDAR